MTVTPEKLLALGLYRLAHGNSYITIGPNFNVGKSTVIEAVQDVVEALCDLRNEYIKFPSTNREVLATRETFDDLTDLPNVVGFLSIDSSTPEILSPYSCNFFILSRKRVSPSSCSLRGAFAPLARFLLSR